MAGHPVAPTFNCSEQKAAVVWLLRRIYQTRQSLSGYEDLAVKSTAQAIRQRRTHAPEGAPAILRLKKVNA
jgi:hypothetical protein